MSTGTELSREELDAVLKDMPSVKSDLNLFLTRLRRKQLSGAQQCGKATIEIIRSLMVRSNFPSADYTMKVLRAIGREMMAAAPSEFIIGNLIRRILLLVREEHKDLAAKPAAAKTPVAGASQDSAAVPAPRPPNANPSQPPKLPRRDRSGSTTSVTSIGSAGDAVAINLQNLNVAVTVDKPVRHDIAPASLLDLFDLQINSKNVNTENFSEYVPNLKLAVINAINELSNECDNFIPIYQKAKEYVSVGECILVYGYSPLVEVFIKAAAPKRKFKVMIAEADPSLDGHKLMNNLLKVPNVSLTILPDSNIYAVMSRVNKVIISPLSVMGDGGAICTSGHHMVATCAKEFSVPVVGLVSAYTITPLFSHNHSHVLNQLTNPAAVLPYHSDTNFHNVEVHCPAFDFIPPDLVDLYVTADGSILPSHVFQQLSEHYHPKDYIL